MGRWGGGTKPGQLSGQVGGVGLGAQRTQRLRGVQQQRAELVGGLGTGLDGCLAGGAQLS